MRKPKLLKFFVTLSMLVLCAFAYGESNQVITGRVLDENGQPMLGVTIFETDSKRGTTTNVDGEYKLRVSSAASVVQFSYIGYEPIEVVVNSQSTINLSMVVSEEKIDPVVVVGYGTMRKSDITGSVTSIGSDVLSERVIVSMEDAMKGRAAGLQIVQNDGAPGSDYTMRIRGASSVNASSAPIFVVDGVIYDDASTINSGDISTIDILKDASATAIYGSRGANGVILVTTKSGSVGDAKVDFYANVGVSEPSRTYDMMNSEQYALMRYQATGWTYYPYGTNMSSITSGTIYRDSPYADANYYVLQSSDKNSYADWGSYANGVDTDWQDVMFQSAILQEYRVNISGGSQKTKYALSGGYLNQEGIIINSGYERYTGRLNLEQALNKKLRMIANISATHTYYKGNATGSSDGIINSLLRQAPTTPYYENTVVDEDGEESYSLSNPYYQMMENTRDKYRDKVTARLSFEYQLSKNISLRAAGTYDASFNKNNYFYPSTTSAGFKYNGRAIVENSDSRKLMGELFANYQPTIDEDNKLKVMVGTTVESYTSSSLTTENQDFPDINLGIDGMGMAVESIVANNSITEWNLASALTRVEYGYKEKYLATATLRADGSSRFGDGNKWGLFPSLGLAWRITEEGFLKSATNINNLKLRVGYGRSGNTAIPSYQSLSTLETASHPMDGETLSYGVKIDRTANPSLHWETTDMINIGLDFSMWKSRLNMTLELYTKTTSDLLLEKNAPYVSGYETGWDNIGEINNKGVEFSINVIPVYTRNFTWTSDFNIAFNKSKVLDIGPGGEMGFDPGIISGSGNFVLIREGESLGQWYGYNIEGVYKSQYEIDEHGMTEVLGNSSSTIQPGDYKFTDQNGDDKINSDDLTILGSGEPLFTGGFYNSFTYKQFDFSVMLQFSYGADAFNGNLQALESGRDGYNQTTNMSDCWSPTLYDSSGNVFFQGDSDGVYRFPGGDTINYCTSRMIEDASFLRISDISLGYTLNKSIMKRLGMRSIKVFATVSNLWVFTKYSGYDPEVNTRQGQTGDMMQSLDYSAYPRSRTYSMGVKVQF